MTETYETAASSTPPPRQGQWRPKVRWFAAEILVVVAGVLIALALNAWWGARLEAREEQRLLAALFDEFTTNEERLGDLVAFHQDVKATTQTLLAFSAEPTASLAADSVDQLLADATWWSSYTTLESTVLDAAVQDGQLDLVQTDSLRRLLSAWRSQVASVTAQSQQEFAHYSEVWLPLLRAEGDLGQISNRATVIPGTKTPYQGESVPPPTQRADHRPLVRSRTLRNALVQKLWIEDDVLYQYGSLRALLSRILVALEQEIPGAEPA